MVKQTIQIFARVKPTVRKQQQGIYSIDEDEKLTPSLEIILPRDLADGFVNNKRESYRFKFQRIFDQDAKQETIFENIAKPVAESPVYSGLPAPLQLTASCCRVLRLSVALSATHSSA
uniref:Kinesin family member 6 n=1 Tax=Bos mutus grunniens TaxID=30521 RepID=A0A8B9YP29_BOSMU